MADENGNVLMDKVVPFRVPKGLPPRAARIAAEDALTTLAEEVGAVIAKGAEISRVRIEVRAIVER